MKTAFLLFLGFTLSACDGGHKQEAVKRYKLKRAEIGLSQRADKQVATIVLHCDDQTRYFTSEDISNPAEIVERFRKVLPIAASYRTNCELEIAFSQYHCLTITDQQYKPQKDAWFRFKPRTELSQGFWVVEYAEGVPAGFTASFSQDLNIPLVFRDTHYVQTKPHSPP
ncbi:MAG: hypothetical protein EOP84_24975 [Verrucomicrobiaceae bacterium]|nr:MAG: hypothetical protein EOP84_24975 [Verrucomicrobiaceae bacterium]